MAIAISLPRLKSHIEALSRFGRNPEGQGITRSCWSPAHEEARAWLLDKMKEAGLATKVDPAGNTFGRLGGEGPVVMTGPSESWRASSVCTRSTKRGSGRGSP